MPVTTAPTGSRASSSACRPSDGARAVTARADHTTRVRELSMDEGSLADWQRRARCALFALETASWLRTTALVRSNLRREGARYTVQITTPCSVLDA